MLFIIAISFSFLALIISVEMFFKKLWVYYKYYIWMFFLRKVFFPSLVFLKRFIRINLPNYISTYNRNSLRLRRAASAFFWRVVSLIEHSPARFREIARGIYRATKHFILSFRATHVFLDSARWFFKVYFRIVSFRRLLCVYLVLDHFVYRWSDLGIDKDLRMWNLCVLCLFFNILYMLMDGSDKRLTHNSHDFITKAYLRRYVGTEPSRTLTKQQMSDPIMAKYIDFRYRRNAVLALFGFFYTGQPLFRSYK